jgi:hypothetical protein
MRTFRHIPTQSLWITNPVDKDSYILQGYPINVGFVIPNWIIEGSSIWEEIEYLFTTDDGVKINKGDTWWYVVLENLSIHKTDNLRGKPIKNPAVVRFSNVLAAAAYVNNKLFSK